jgi:X-X-X-Leu-X-X-Gly heptad repeat protein
MAIKTPVPPSDRISASLFKQLADSAARLNSGSDELAKAIRPIDVALKKLNLGVAAWYPYIGSEEPDSDGDYYCRRIGYAKVSGKWGLALSTVSGNAPHDVHNYEEWLFNDAPRRMRLEALDHIPDLLEQLVKEANKVAEDLQNKAVTARKLAETISALSATTEVRR